MYNWLLAGNHAANRAAWIFEQALGQAQTEHRLTISTPLHGRVYGRINRRVEFAAKLIKSTNRPVVLKEPSTRLEWMAVRTGDCTRGRSDMGEKHG